MVVALANQRTRPFFLVYSSIHGSPLFPTAHSTCLSPPPPSPIYCGFFLNECGDLNQQRQDRKSGCSGFAFSISVSVVKVNTSKAKGSHLHAITDPHQGTSRLTGSAKAPQVETAGRPDCTRKKEGRKTGRIPQLTVKDQQVRCSFTPRSPGTRGSVIWRSADLYQLYSRLNSANNKLATTLSVNANILEN
jgi:hypothetical protein